MILDVDMKRFFVLCSPPHTVSDLLKPFSLEDKFFKTLKADRQHLHMRLITDTQTNTQDW